uniref:Uncharacterized protein n=1 Tax=Neobodo designis TaxID=312471 RepID=A0A7S1W5N7_NEODS|mmetsp:Transcript_53648/g.164987  ORF Transcript_53648/g.164987 Transcript_53648/m.164987 type:complete len:1002 (+) Transcript_53648:198-3203(+)|eukprot:CAMPEP_0174852868 /NCGR_PEP_ID=MMETSP1114-20130205/27103_1 /TAXON_ID=312471 /ORGANISM="Neobodo designis, Strain CCAP 1951/1" /LENGTH=1001 /DNA_ID=CAMNT_0016087485 /DNA_START=196 /DNA_END=3201 /DNA_ORIENTATION=+
MSAEAAAQPPATGGTPAEGDTGAVPVNSYYLPDNTWVQVMSDGTEYHYPPEDGTGGEAGGQVQYDPATGNPLGNEFNPETQYYQQHYAGQATYDANGNLVTAGDGMAPPVGAAPAPQPAEEHSHGKKSKSREKDEGDQGAVTAGADDDDQAANGVSAPQTMHAESAQTSGFWIVDVIMEAYFSLAFKLWACQLFVSTWIITLFYGLNLEFAVLFRVVAPPEQDADITWQSLGYLMMFLALSFLLATVINCETTIIREIWTSKPTDLTLMGISMGSTQPPYVVSVVLVLSLTVLPVLWSMILTLATERTGAYFVQFFLYISVMIAFVLMLIVYTILWVNAFRLKTTAYSEKDEEVEGARDYKSRHKHKASSDDESDASSESESESESESDSDEDQAASAEGGEGKKKKKKHRKRRHRHHRHRKEKKSKKKSKTHAINVHGRRLNQISAFDSEHTLEEFGLHPRTVRWMIPAFVVGLAPAIVVAVTFAFDETSPDWTPWWFVIAVLALMGFILLAEASSRLKVRNGTVVTIIFICLAVLVGILGTGLSGNPANIGIFLFLLLATHCLMLRKRPYELLPHEIEQRFGPAVDMRGDGDPFDSYLCLCKNTLMACFRCADMCDIYGIFGKKAPEVRAFEKEYRHENLTLVSDQRLLLWKWVLLWILMAVGLGTGRDQSPFIGAGLAAGGDPSPKVNQTVPWFCNLKWNTEYTQEQLDFITTNISGSGRPATFGVRELSHLNLATYANGGSARSALETFLFYFPSVQWDPNQVPGGDTDHVARHGLRWIHFHENITEYHFVAVTAQARGVGMMRAIDAYGEWLALNAAAALSPFIAAWPVTQKREWIEGAGFFKRWMGGDIQSQMSDLDNFIKNIKASQPAPKGIVLIGGGYNGAFARAIAHRNNVQSVAFNSAGTSYMHGAFGMSAGGTIVDSVNHFAFNTDTDAFNQVGGHVGDANFVTFPCSGSRTDRTYIPECSRPWIAPQYFLDQCGDDYGVRVSPDIVNTP